MVRKMYRSLQGKLVDMELLAQKHELTPAVGNARVNARGDELGTGGRIVKTREQTQKTLAPQRVVRNVAKEEKPVPKVASKNL